MEIYHTPAILREWMIPAPGAEVEIQGLARPHDGAGGRFVALEVNPGSYDPQTPPGVLMTSQVSRGVIWVRQFEGPVNPRWWGARGGAIQAQNAAISAESNQLSTAHDYGNTDVTGWAVAVAGAGPGGSTLRARVVGREGPVLLLDTAAHETVAGAEYMAGPDDTAAIQAALDWAICGEYQRRRLGATSWPDGCPVGGAAYLPPGQYLITDTLHMGYGFTGASGGYAGPTYAGGLLRGDRYGYGGSTILAAFDDRPAIAVQGGRGTRIEAVGLVGLNKAATMGGVPAVNMADPSDSTAWHSPHLPASAHGRYTPYAAIAIDPYCGPTPPGGGYPPVTYPSWVGGAGPIQQYRKGQSSHVGIEGVRFEGFAVGVAVQPCDYDGNADFVRIKDCVFLRTTYPISVGNTQSRNVEVSSCAFAMFHTALTTGVVGRQNGKLGGVASNCSFGEGVQIIDCPNPRAAGPLEIVNCQSEALWRLGRWGQGNTPGSALSFRGGQYGFHLQLMGYGIPAAMLESGAPSGVSMRGATLINYYHLAVLDGHAPSWLLDGVIAQPTPSGPLESWEQQGWTFLAGVMHRPEDSHACRPSHSRLHPRPMYRRNGSEVSVPQIDDVDLCVGSRSISAWSRAAAPAADIDQVVQLPRMWHTLGGVTDWDLKGRNLVFTRAQQPHEAQLHGPMPGDVLWHAPSGSVFFVSGRDGDQVTAVLQTNYRDADGVIEHGRPIEPVDALHVGNSRMYMPTYATYATATLQSPVLTAVGRPGGNGSYLPGEIQVGDWLWPYGGDIWIDARHCQVVAVANGTITLSGAPSMAGRRRLAFFIRGE